MEKISKKIQILDASEDLFFKMGFDGASTRAIAKIARVNMAMINYYFGSKEGLFLAVIVRLLQQFGVQIVDIDRQDIGTKEKFTRVMELYAERILSRPETYLIIHREMKSGRSKEMSDMIADRIYQNHNAMAQLLKKGIDNKEYKNVDISMVLATLKGFVMHVVFAPEKVNHSEAIGFETPEMKQKTIDKVKQHIKVLIDSTLVA